jgi:TolA-binding protein
MNSPDLHPEELLDRAAQGTLSDEQRATLDRHLAVCAVCRFEQQARADFLADAAAAENVNLESMVTAALAGIQRPARRRVSSRAGVLIAASLSVLAFSSFAAVAQWTGVLPKLIEKLTVTETTPEPAPAPAPVHPHGQRAIAPVIDPVIEETPAAVEGEIKPAPPAAAPAHVAAPSTDVPSPSRTAPPVHVASNEPSTPAIPETAVKVTPPPPDASSLFGAANDARTHGDRQAAVSLYRDLLLRFPSSDEANVTHAALGRLLLDLGDARGALAELRAYLAGGDTALREEALVDCAVASGKLGDVADERDCWKTLLDAYPASVHAGRARGRLGELELP